MMHMKKTIVILGALLASSPVLADNSIHYNIVDFDERASVTVPNDTMHITLTITEQNKNRETASHAVTRKMNAVQAKIRQNKQLIAELGNRSVYPQYNDKNQITSWQDTAYINVKSTDFATLTKLAADVQNNAMLQGVHFSVSPEKRSKAVEQASEEAIKAFQQRALFISKNLGFSGYKIVKLDLHSGFDSHHMSHDAMRPAAASLKTARATSMEMDADNAGKAEISQTVRVSIQMH